MSWPFDGVAELDGQLKSNIGGEIALRLAGGSRPDAETLASI